eukprot:TRINITY_DN2157_c1_g1_i1.p1 TRINITY_DN2157_c1_g1~~TRINITY_DN2157_c1_g1_i1.p1  ORF type:complete len:511 (+),score=110.19 TRINITY_DN2157_c1_g1_i1:153-1685(+)
MPYSSASSNSEIRCKFLGLSLAPLGLMSILSGLVILAVTEWHAVYIWKGNRAITSNLRKTETCTPADENTNHLVSAKNCQLVPPPDSVPVQDHILAGLVKSGFSETLPVSPEQAGFLAFHREIEQYQFTKDGDGSFKKTWSNEFIDLSSDEKAACQQQLGEPCLNKQWPKAFSSPLGMITPQLSLTDGNGAGYNIDSSTFGEKSLFSAGEASWETLKVQQLATSPTWQYGDYLSSKNLRNCGTEGWLHLNYGSCTPVVNSFRIRWKILPRMNSVVVVGKQVRSSEGYELVAFDVEGYSEKPPIAVISSSGSKVESLLPLSDPGISVYLLRVAGYLLSWLGTHLLLSSMESSRVANFITSIQELSNTKLFVYGNTAATFLALLTIGVIWVTVQSILAIPLILSLVSVVGIFFVIKRSVSNGHQNGYDGLPGVPVVVHSIQNDIIDDADDEDDEEASLSAITGVGVLPDDDEKCSGWLSVRPPSPPLRKSADAFFITNSEVAATNATDGHDE